MLFNQDAVYYGQAIKNGSVTSKQLVEQTIENIEKLNPILNAVIYTYADYAMERADELDKQLASLSEADRQKLSPFYGVPLLLKDIGQYWKGRVTSSGSHLLLDQRAGHSDTSIQMLEDVGFVFVGRSNIPEFGLKTISDSKSFGMVKNPVHLDYNPGGSSGGAAAAVKSGMVPLATGSDAGGSIRVPASDTGLIGLKPSRGRVAEGPSFYRPVNGLATNLVMARSVRDVFYGLKTVQKDQITNPNRLPIINEERLEGLDRPLKIAYTTQHPRGLKNSKDALQAVERTVEILKDLGHQVEEVQLNIDGNKVMKAYYASMAVETGKIIHKIEQSGTPINFEELDSLTWVTYQIAPHVPAFVFSDIAEYQDALFEYMETFYQSWDLLLTPAVSDVAVKNEDLIYPEDLLEKIKNMGSCDYERMLNITHEAFDFTYLRTSYSQLMNITGQPAISLPIYENEAGLSLGSQFSSKRGNEYQLLQLAKQLEDLDYLKADIVRL